MNGWDAARFGWLLACTLVASVTDVRERRIPNWVVVPCAAATPVWWLTGIVAWSPSLLGGALVGGLFLVPTMLGRAGMGDAKLAAAIGLALGWQAAGALLVGTAVGLVVAAAMSHSSGPREVNGWPLAPTLLVGVIMVGVVSVM